MKAAPSLLTTAIARIAVGDVVSTRSLFPVALASRSPQGQGSGQYSRGLGLPWPNRSYRAALLCFVHGMDEDANHQQYPGLRPVIAGITS